MKTPFIDSCLPVLLAAALLHPIRTLGANADQRAVPENLWELGKAQAGAHRFSTLFTAQDVRDQLSNPDGLRKALDWCRQTAVTKVYIETFRDGYQADRAALATAKKQFQDSGFIVSGCVTPTKVGKSSTGWKNTISCYTDQPTQEKVRSIFADTAALFDEIMMDDFWFTDCACPECDSARRNKSVLIGARKYPVNGDTWEDYRCELMTRLSQDCVLAPAKNANPKAALIIKYPQWYDRFHERGYEVLRETADFDRIWVGTESRNYDDPRWGGTPQYESFFIMRWLGEIGGAKCGGGWFDPYGTTEATYVEQARQTVLGGAAESMLFCYGSLLRDTGPKNVQALRNHIPELLAVAREVRARTLAGIAAYKPANSHPENEARVFDFVGMMGLPLVPCHVFPADAPAAFFSIHSLKDPDLASKLTRFIAAGKPALLTDGLAAALTNRVRLDAPNVQILEVKGDPKTLLQLAQDRLDSIRVAVLKPLKATFKAPNKVGFYLFRDGSWVVENFNDSAVTVEVNGKTASIPPREWLRHWN